MTTVPEWCVCVINRVSCLFHRMMSTKHDPHFDPSAEMKTFFQRDGFSHRSGSFVTLMLTLSVSHRVSDYRGHGLVGLTNIVEP